MTTQSETVSFPSRDGSPIPGTLQPAQSEPRALALLVHGIHSEQHESGFFTRLAQLLSADGIASLRFDWRTQGLNDEMPLSELTLFGIVNDIAGAWRWLSNRYSSVESPPILIASSFGGGPALVWSVSADSPTPMRGIFLAPVLDFAFDLFRQRGVDGELFLEPEESAELAKVGYISRDSLKIGRDLVNELPHFSPEEAFERRPYPAWVLHGELDSDVPLSGSRAFADQSSHVTLSVVPGVDHGFVEPGTDFTDQVNRPMQDAVIAQIRDLAVAALA